MNVPTWFAIVCVIAAALVGWIYGWWSGRTYEWGKAIEREREAWDKAEVRRRMRDKETRDALKVIERQGGERCLNQR